MSDIPETRFAKIDDLHIAYQVLGEGPLDVVLLQEWFCHLDVQWEVPQVARALRRLASFSRLILFDHGGTGLSDPRPLGQLPTLEVWMDEVRAVMGAVGSEHAALVSAGSGSPMAMLFAATHPDRTRALVLMNSYSRLLRAEDYPEGLPPRLVEPLEQWMDDYWGVGTDLPVTGPSVVGDERFRDLYARWQRVSASPGAFAAIRKMVMALDVRDVLPSIPAPTLVLHREGDQFVRASHGQYVADHIPDATYVELPGADHHYFLGDADALMDEIQEFLTGVREPVVSDRVLATVLFTDIVGSTERAAELGDRGWRELVERHHALVRRQLTRFRGREVDTAGDGFFAAFDGPARAIRCGQAVQAAVRGLGIEVRVGLHTGECETVDGKIGGIAVNTGARVAGLAGPGEVLVSRTVADLVAGSGIEFADRGSHALKGVPGEWQLYAVES